MEWYCLEKHGLVKAKQSAEMLGEGNPVWRFVRYGEAVVMR